MKKFFFKSLAIGLLALIPAMSWAVENITVHNGTVENETIPVWGYNLDAKYTHNQMIVSKTDVASMAGKEIIAMQFFLKAAATANFINNWTITLVETSKQTVTGSYESLTGGVEVYTGTIDWKTNTPTITFDNGFTYSGNNNLLIDFQYNNSNSTYQHMYFYGVSNGFKSQEGHGNNAPSSANIYGFSPKIKFSYQEPPSCTAAKSIAIPQATIEQNQAKVTWVAGKNETQWKVIVKDGTLEKANAIVNTTPEYTITDLLASTKYTLNVSVQAICGEGDSATATVKDVTFRTACGAVTVSKTTPYVNGFEDDEANADPICFTVHKNSGTYPIVQTSYPHTGNKSLSMGGYSGVNKYSYTVLPEFTNNISDLKMEFYLRGYSSTQANNDKIEVGVMEDPNLTSTYTKVSSQFQAVKDAYEKCEVDFSNYTGTGKYIVIKRSYVSSGSYPNYKYYGSYIDDITVSMAPSCKKPKNLSTSNETLSSAELTWEAGSSETAWRLQYRECGTEAWSSEIDVVSIPFSLSGLVSSTSYEFRVMADCGGGEESEWSAPTTFGTLCGELVFDKVYSFEADADNADPRCWGVYTAGGNKPYVITSSSYAHNGSKAIYMNFAYNGKKAWAVMPKVPDSINVADLKISAFAGGSTNYSCMDVGVMTDPSDTATFQSCGISQVLPVLPNKSAARSDISLDKITNNGKYIAFVITSNATAYLDDVSVTKLLERPTNVQVDADKDSAEVTFDQDNSKGKWEYQLDAAAIVTITSQKFTLTGLEGATNYTLKIRHYNESTGERSGWVEKKFSTTCNDYALSATNPFIENFAGKQLPACWSEFTESAFAGSYSSGNIYFNAIRAYFLPKMDFTNLSASACMFSFDASNSLSNVKILAAASLDGVTPQNIEDYVIATITVDQVRRYDVYLSDYASQLSGKSYIGFVNTATALTIDSIVLKKAPAVRKPKDVTIGDTKYNKASIVSLTQEGQVTGGTWSYEIDKVNTFDSEAWNMEEFSEMPAVIEALDETSTYYVRVKYIVNSDESEFSDVVSFTTSAAPVAIPYSDGFESYTGSTYDNATASSIPTKWTTYSTGSVRPHVISTGSYKYVHTGDKALTFYGRGYCYAAMPEFDVEISKLEVSFWMQQESASNGELVLGYITAADVNMNTFVQLTAFGKTSTMTQRNVRMDDFEIPANAVRLVFRWYYSGQYSCCIDDVLVKKAKCKAPTPEVSSITTSSAVLSIQEDVAWAYKTTEEGTPVAVAASETVSLTDLEANTEYIVYVQSACSADDKSDFVADTFRTACEAQVALGYSEDFADGIPTCMKAINTTYNQYGTKYVTMSDKAALILPIFESTTDWSTLQLSFNGSTNSTDYPVLKVIAYDETVAELANQEVLASVNLASSMTGMDVYLNEIADINTKMAGKRLGLYRVEVQAVSIDDIVIKTASQFKAPTNLAMTAESETAEGADFTFEQPGVATNVWVVEVATENSFAENKIAKRDTITATSFTLTGLNMKTKYYVRVKQMDGEVSSNFSNVVEFTTECGQLALNTVYDMESYSAGTSSYDSYRPNCWGFSSYSTTYKPYVYSSTTYNHTTGGSKSMRLQGYSSSAPTLFTMPVAGDDIDFNMVTITFWAISNQSNGVDLKVGVLNSSNVYSATNFKVAETVKVPNVMTKFTVRLNGLTDLTTAHKYITFANATGNSYTYVYVDDIEVKMSACAMASGAAASEITDVTAKLSITNAEPNWNVVVKAGNDTAFAQSGITTANVVATGLSAQTDYVAYITMNCPLGGESDPVEVKFTTACAALTIDDVVDSVLYFQGFENGFDACETKVAASASYPSITTSYKYEGSKAMEIYTYSGYQALVLPEMNITWADYQLSMFVRLWSGSTAKNIMVAVTNEIPALADLASLTPISTFNITSTTFAECKLQFKDVDASTFENARYVVMFINSCDLVVDNIKIKQVPAPVCPKAEGAAASDITASSATISITNATPNWNIVVKSGETTAFSQDNITEASVSATGLSAETAYKAIITMNCVGGVVSDPDTITFTTAEFVCPVATGAAASDITAHSATISITNAQPNWNIVVKAGEIVAFEQDSITEASVSATGLNAETAYEAIITMNCVGNVGSDPDTTEFTTTAVVWEPAREGLVLGQLGTMCAGKNILDVRGGILYGIDYGTTQMVEFVEKEMPIAAGEPLLFQADGTNDGKMEIEFGTLVSDTARHDAGKLGVKGLVGLVSGANVAIEPGNILVNGGKLRLVGADCFLSADHAYIKANEMPTQNSEAPGRRIRLTQNGTDVVTDLMEVKANEEGVFKFVRDGQMFILRDGKLFNAQGQIVK